MKKILFIRSDRFGEFLLSLPAIKLVKINYPQSKIYLLAQKINIELIKDIDFINSFFEYEQDEFRSYRGAFRLARLLKKESLDCLVVLNPKKEFHLASLLAQIPLRVGYDRKWGFCLNRKIKDSKHLGNKHEVEYNIELVSLLCEKVFIPDIQIPTDTKDSLNFLRYDIDVDRQYIVIHPFSSNPLKKIADEFWEELILKIKASSGDSIILIGSKDEENQGRMLQRRLGLKNIVGKLSLRNLATFFKYNCRVFVGLDSGPMHLASFSGIPVVGLFTISNPTRWKPYRATSLVVEAKDSRSIRNRIAEIANFVYQYQF